MSVFNGGKVVKLIRFCLLIGGKILVFPVNHLSSASSLPMIEQRKISPHKKKKEKQKKSNFNKWI